MHIVIMTNRFDKETSRKCQFFTYIALVSRVLLNKKCGSNHDLLNLNTQIHTRKSNRTEQNLDRNMGEMNVIGHSMNERE